MRTITATLLATTLIVTSAFAAPHSVTPLPAGKPAGGKEAALFGPNSFLILLGAGVVIGGLVLTVSGNSNGITGPTTTSTSTSGLP
jgi:hypothetical protein